MDMYFQNAGLYQKNARPVRFIWEDRGEIMRRRSLLTAISMRIFIWPYFMTGEKKMRAKPCSMEWADAGRNPAADFQRRIILCGNSKKRNFLHFQKKRCFPERINAVPFSFAVI